MKKLVALAIALGLAIFSTAGHAQVVAPGATVAEQAKIASAVQAGVAAALAARDASDAAAKIAGEEEAEANRHAGYGWGAIIGIGLAVVVGAILVAGMLSSVMMIGVAPSGGAGGIVLLILISAAVVCGALWLHGLPANG